MEKLMVYLPLVSTRAEYIFTLMIRDLAGAEMILTDRLGEYLSYSGPRLEYAPEPSGEGLFIRSCGLLSEQSIKEQSIGFLSVKGTPAFFPVNDERSAFPFDLFAAAFYLVTRYEEYLPFVPDKYGRFRASDSLAATGNFLQVPIVNIWSESLKDHLKQIYPSLRFREKKFRFLPTVDIDHAYAYRQRNLLRILGGYGRSLLHGNLKKIIQQSGVLLGYRKDPYDQYDAIREIHDRFGLSPLYFVLYADYGGDDNNVTRSGRTFLKLLHNLDDKGLLGIHPSLASGMDPGILQSEIRGLSEVLGHEITRSRQHFLKVSFPENFRGLVRHGITDDYSLGYASCIGFRAGIADPFPFFDLLSNRSEPLMLHPVALMDVTLKDYCGISAEEAKAVGRSVADAIKAVKGEFVTVWHNESFDETGRWKGWGSVYEDLLMHCDEMR
ncbi:MAG: polysaccharide deacetylase family protein [Bacteroidetes bacterium]|nr:polysaccharide deacetylase family protein [Bacteroidota bacterium]